MAEATLQALENLRQTLPEPARDLKINLSNVFKSEHLTTEQIWGTALASAFYLRDPKLIKAIYADAKSENVGDTVLQDAEAAAAIMGMNTVYYRFRHLSGKEAYSQKPARLRMQWMLKPQTSKADYELFCMAVAALAGCEACIKAHDKSILENGLTEDHVHDVVRLAAVLQGVAVALSSAQ